MKEQWKNTVITRIGLAVYVAPNTGRHVHKDRMLHGFVLNDADTVKDYCFADGRVMHTEGNSLFYLPKGSSYDVKIIQMGGCYAINFDADIGDAPFSIHMRNAEALRQSFRTATDAWRQHDGICRILAMRAVYDAVYHMQTELHKEYVSRTQASVIEPAIAAINDRFAENDLTVSYLASLCRVSEVYFRRLFLNTFGVGPKEYIIQKRMDYAKILLRSGDFSIAEAALMCGYVEPCHFSREFSRRVGMMPSRYLEK